jgi:cytosine/uracil/thiamine/allantoin permease
MGVFDKFKNRPGAGFRFPKPEPFSLKLTPQAGSYATNPRWSNKDLDPVPVKYRTWGTLDFFNYCTESCRKAVC